MIGNAYTGIGVICWYNLNVYTENRKCLTNQSTNNVVCVPVCLKWHQAWHVASTTASLISVRKCWEFIRRIVYRQFSDIVYSTHTPKLKGKLTVRDKITFWWTVMVVCSSIRFNCHHFIYFPLHKFYCCRSTCAKIQMSRTQKSITYQVATPKR